MMADENPTMAEKEPAEAQAAPGGEPAAETPPKADATEALQAEVNELKDKLLRTLAEMENLRRRTEREVADQRQYAVTAFARDMLTVGDNLRRAIEAVPKEMRDGRDPALNALIEGVEVTERGLEQSLGKFGVRRIAPKGQKFDPGFHQAMFEVESPDLAPGTVVEEMQAGYAIGDRVLRPALVSISKKPAKLPESAPAEAAANENAG